MVRKHGRVSKFGLLFVVIALGACAVDSPSERLGSSRSDRLSTREVTLRFPSGTFGEVPLAAMNGALSLGGGVRVEHPDGTPARAVQLGEGEVLVNASVGSLIAQDSVVLGHHARVSGDVTSGHDVHRFPGAVVTGSVTERTSVRPDPEERIAAPAAGPVQSFVLVLPGQSRELAPGGYGPLSVSPRGKLRLRSGDYAFSSASFNLDAELVVDDADGPVRVFVDDGFSFFGRVTTTGTIAPALLVAQLDGPLAVLGAPFRGTVMAPRSTIVLHAGWAPHEGSFFGRSIDVRPGAKVVYRPFFRLEARQAFTVPNGAAGPFTDPSFDDQGGFLTAGGTNVLRVSAAGASAAILSEPSNLAVELDPRGARFGVYRADKFEVHDRTGSLIASADLEPAGHATFVPDTDRFYVPKVGSDPEKPRVSEARFYSPGGLQATFAAPELRISRLTGDRMIYATNSHLVRTNLAGIEAWRVPLELETFEISRDGSIAVGLRRAAGRSEVVHVDLASGAVVSSTVLSDTFWNVAVAPSGRYSAVTTKRSVYLFERGRVVREVALPVEWTISVDVTDDGVVGVGAQLADHSARAWLLGPPGTAAWSAPRAQELHGYRPSVRFYPGGKRFITNESAGLAVFDVERTR